MTSNQHLCFVHDAGNKGFGLFAITSMAQGTLIIQEKVDLWVEHTNNDELPGNGDKRWNNFKTADAYAYFNPQFMVPHNRPRTKTNIFQANAWTLEWCPKHKDKDGLKLNRSGIFRTLVRANRSCLPNAHFSYNCETKLGSLHACRQIVQGEEIITSYIDDTNWKDTSGRRAELQDKWGFECQCVVCNEQVTGVYSREWRRQEIRQAWNHLSSLEQLVLGSNNPPIDTILSALPIIRNLCDLIESELGGIPDITPDRIVVPRILDPRLCILYAGYATFFRALGYRDEIHTNQNYHHKAVLVAQRIFGPDHWRVAEENRDTHEDFTRQYFTRRRNFTTG